MQSSEIRFVHRYKCYVTTLQVLRHYTTSVHLHRSGIGFLGEIQVIFWIYILYCLEEMPTARTNCHASGTIAIREDRTG
ncbi:hypothetical protein L1987_74478 [Smallanthus sonchifolius]|uniref:Uncharacterized protein n=1 Tax=Smallanthus sonchifolius TaxID=185202 RepID=A0ACB9A358_9ASTR|nr:hypothetical protein L1987_74478 [Smallanthus sonchifolius]